MEKNTNFTPAIIIGLFVLIVVLACGLTNYKSELLICSKTKNVCKIEKTNLFNMKSKKEIVKYSEIAGVTYYRQRVKGNRYGKGYKEYLLVFNMKNGNQINIFSKSYYDKAEINAAVKNLTKKINSSDDVIQYSRDN